MTDARRLKAGVGNQIPGSLLEALVNVSRNYNGSKVNMRAALVKFGYMLEHLGNPELLWHSTSIDEYAK